MYEFNSSFITRSSSDKAKVPAMRHPCSDDGSVFMITYFAGLFCADNTRSNPILRGIPGEKKVAITVSMLIYYAY
jgi:hypothetical protein